MNDVSIGPSARPSTFGTTQWSLVLTAKDKASPESEQALAQLCQTYWYPLFAFIRRKGHNATEAEDYTQGFFTSLLETDLLKSVDPDRGRFRSFLLKTFSRFVTQQIRRAHAQKRGGSKKIFSFDFEEGERRYTAEPFHELTAEQLFDRHWALTLLQKVIEKLQQEHHQTGRDKLFDALKVYLTGDDQVPGYRDMAQSLGMKEGAVKVAVHRLRQRFRFLLQEEIAQTVADAADVEEEMQTLFKALHG